MESTGGVTMAKPLEHLVSGEEKRKCGSKAFSCSLVSSERKLVCVTTGNSFFGSQLVKKLVARGYWVRVTIQNQVDFEQMRELIKEEEMNQLESVVVAKFGDMDSLTDAFRGCHAVFHTSSFIDPHGISGYSERMAFLETEGARNVIEACRRAAYGKRCIFTSSLLASIWKDGNADGIIDDRSWSDEEFCRENKLWLALGKTTAEKVAWMKSRDLKVKLVTLCPGLLMAPSFSHLHSQTYLPYLKGGRAMLQKGVLAVVDEGKVAEAHIHVYEAMDNGACGRYLCFERVVRRMDEAIQLENSLKIEGLLSGGREDSDGHMHAVLSNSKLARLISEASRRASCGP